MKCELPYRPTSGRCSTLARPLVITIAGGYAATAECTAGLHAIVFAEAARLVAAGDGRYAQRPGSSQSQP